MFTSDGMVSGGFPAMGVGMGRDNDMVPLAFDEMIYHYFGECCIGRAMLKIESGPVVGDWLDGAATCASAACLVHCLLLPLILAALPALAGSIDPGERFHALILLFAIPTSALALLPGWHRSGAAGPVLCGAAGVALLASGVAIFERPLLETTASVAGSLLLAGAHVANWRMRRIRCAAKIDCKDGGECSC
ncbi:MAG TPA: MerC domain-containing protein [Novosphingobium sp.]|nr:MerC domain-containing protein [Novosphingobium sp.]